MRIGVLAAVNSILAVRYSPMAKRSSHIAAPRHVRLGEGIVIETTRQTQAGTDGTTSLTVAFDVSQAPVPERRYVSDCLAILSDEHVVRLCFGQRKVGEGGIRSLLIIHLTFDAVQQFLKSINDFNQAIRGYANKVTLPVTQLIDIKEEPTQTVAVTANIIAASFSNRDACFDFYHVSAFVMSQLKQGGAFVADPVVRVNVSTAIVIAVLDRFQSISAALPAPALEEL